MMIAIAVATLAMFDALLAGFRAAAGRDGRIDKRGLYREALLRAMLWAALMIAANATVAASLVGTAPDPIATWRAFVAAGTACTWVFGAFATLTLLALSFWFSPSPEYRLLATVIVLGPLTLIRPLVIVAGLAIAVTHTDEARVIVLAVVAGTSMLIFEPLLGRAYAQRWRRLV